MKVLIAEDIESTREQMSRLTGEVFVYSRIRNGSCFRRT